MANRAAFYIKTPSILYQNARRFMAKRIAFPYKTPTILAFWAKTQDDLAQNRSRFGPKHAAFWPKTQKLINNDFKIRKVSKTFCTFVPKKDILDMSYTKTTVIKNPSRKLEERIRKIGVQKYLWLEELCSDEVKPTKVILVR